MSSKEPSETIQTYVELKRESKDLYEKILKFNKTRAAALVAEPAEEHAIQLEKGFYRNIPDYIEDGDFWIDADDSKGESFWDFLGD